MSELYPLNQKDVEAVAKSRINRAEGNKPTLYIVVAMALIIAGFFVANNYAQSQWIGWLVSIAGVVIFWVYMNKLGKKQRACKLRLLQEWYEEQAKEQKGSKK